MGRNSKHLTRLAAANRAARLLICIACSGARLMAVTFIPALICCCARVEVGEPARMAPRAGSPACILDIFFFRDDSLSRLDSYQRMVWDGESPLPAASTRGRKKVCVLANSSDDRYTWAEVNSYEGLQGISMPLASENPALPVMAWEGTCDAGCPAEPRLSPMLARVELSSISCDFHGRPYEESTIENAVAYLVNVSGRCSPFGGDGALPSEILCEGRYRAREAESLRVPGMLRADIGTVGEGVLHPGIELFCYPNESPQEGPGTPFTRLVIEGEIDGETWYWPMDVNRSNGGGGIARGRTYSVDLTITMKGVKDPDTPLRSGAAEVCWEIAPWNEKPERTIRY